MNQGQFLLISGHDYRSKRKANVHFIAESLKRYGKVNFYSIGFSLFSRIKQDPRVDLWHEANRISEFEDINCFLERNLIHPFNTRRDWLNLPERAWFTSYRMRPRSVLFDWVKLSDTILLESGMPVLLTERIAAANPSAKRIYLVSDDLETIGCSHYLRECLSRSGSSFSYAVLPSKLLAGAMPADMRMTEVPHGLDQTLFSTEHPSPYSSGLNAVSVGSMLFDAGFFEIACRRFPEVKFYIIGGGQKGVRVKAENAVVLPDMAFTETLPYIKHASFGIAPYSPEGAPYYLADTSMKLIQYAAAGLNAVCPSFAAGGKDSRFGYQPNDEASIVEAIQLALGRPPARPPRFLSWEEVTDRLLSPQSFLETRMFSDDKPGRNGA
jgi:2-beta-glucuronyltransferase